MTLGQWAGVVLGVVFMAAGASKVSQGARWPDEAAQLGAPRWLSPLVPWWELVMGALLIVGLATPWPAVAAGVTLVVFTALLVQVMRRGERPSCSCFGGWSTKPVGWHHVARNAVFLALAGVALTG